MQTISSQHFRDEDVIQSKRDAQDYEVFVSPAFEFDGQMIRVVLDGHHSFEAAKLDSVEPEWIEQTASENDAIALIEAGKFEDFLAAAWIDGDFYNIETGKDVW